MIKIEKYTSLKKFNTFGIDASAQQFGLVESVEDLQNFIHQKQQTFFILGGGSNILLTQDIQGLVLKNEIKGIELVEEHKESCTVAVGSGENWHQFVLWTIEHNLGGIENLSLIPGTVGAAPIQNIGAYGVELKDVFERLEAVHLQTGELHTFDLNDCQFDYRMSVFKKKYKGLFFITKVFVKLSKKGFHQININYGAIQKILQEKNIQNPTIKNVSDAIIAIRSAKLPDPKVLGNSGSFFKNPIIEQNHFLKLQKAFPDIVFYKVSEDQVKIPAGWLIEQCGWKGKTIGEVACYEKQALVIVNLGEATGFEVQNHAQKVMDSVFQKFGIVLEPEVNII